MKTAEILATTAPFEGLEPEALDALKRAVVREYAAGSSLWEEGDEPQGLFLILEGKVRVLGLRGERQYVVHSEGPGATLGEVPLFGGGCYPATAVAASAVRCLIVDAGSLRRAMHADPELSWRLLGRMAERVAALLVRLDGLAAGTVRSRLASYLLAQRTRSDGPEVSIDGSQEQLAEELGTVREVVARELAWLRENGLVHAVDRGRFEILDEAALETLAG